MPKKILEIRVAKNGFVASPYSDYDMEPTPPSVFLGAAELSDFVMSWASDHSPEENAAQQPQVSDLDFDEVYDVPAPIE